MSDEIKINRPVQAQPAAVSSQPAAEVRVAGTSRLPWVILGVVVVVLVVVGVLFRDKLFAAKSGANTPAVTGKASGYQAVFLTNGQVYFGKVTSMNGEFVTVKDIYYLQVVQQPPLQGQQPVEQQPAQAAQEPQISLVKLGNELHGPVDEMHISKAQILFYEDLKEDGRVVEAIKSYQANPQQ